MNKLIRIERELQKHFLEREEVIRGLLLGLVAGKHVLLVGPPGTGKSMLVQELAARMTGGRKFCYLMTRYTRPEEIIGPVSLQGLEKDQFTRVLRGKSADAHFVFLDEVFNANSACINSILSIMNEGIYYNGNEAIQVPLISLVGAANDLPTGTGGELAAFYDRFLLRYQVDYIRETENLAKLLGIGGAEAGQITYTYHDVHRWQAKSREIRMPEVILKRLVTLVNKLRQAGIQISDRRARECCQVLRANAFISGRSFVGEEDLEVLQHVFWQRPEDREKVKDQLANMCTPLEKRVAQLAAEACQIKLKIDNTDSRGRRMAMGSEVNLRLTEIDEELREVAFLWGGDGMEQPFIKRALDEVRDIHRYVIQSCLGLTPQGVN